MAATRIEAAEHRPLSLDTKATLYSSYVWRGKVLDRHTVMQPCFIAKLDMRDAGSLSGKIWMNWDMSPGSSDFKATTADDGVNLISFVPSYTKALGPVGVTVGNTWYTFPSAGREEKPANTEELFVTLVYRNAIVTPSICLYYDYGSVGGSLLGNNPSKHLYSRISLNKTISLSERLSAGGTVLIGAGTSNYNEVRYGSCSGGSLVDYETAAGISYACTDTLSIGARLSYTGLFGGDLGLDRSNIASDEHEWFRGGISLRWLL